MIIPPLDAPFVRAGEWLLTTDVDGLKKAGVPEANLRNVWINLKRFRVKCATVNAQCLLLSQIKRKQYLKAPNKPAPVDPAKEEHMWKMRDYCAHDLMKTEESYNKQLQILDEVLFSKLLADCHKKNPVLTEEEVKLVFSDIQVLHSVSTSFLESLKNCFKTWDNKTSLLGKVVKGMTQFFRVYADYVRNYDKAIVFLSTLPRNSKLSEFFMENVTNKPELGCNLTLSDLLIVPVQRIPRYPLLLKDIIKYTPQSHPDYANLNEALDGIAKLADWVNENVRKNQSQRVLMRIQSELEGMEEALMTASRIFVKEGEVVELSETEKPRRRVFLLFNDVLIIADPKYDGPFFANTSAPVPSDAGDGLVNILGGDFGTIHGTKKVKARFQWQNTYRLLDIKVEDEPPFSAEFSSCLALRLLKKDKKVIYAAKSVEVRDEWKRTLEETITQQVELEAKKDELRDKAAIPKAEQVKAMLGAQYFSLTNPLTSRRKTRDTVWRTLPAEEKEKVAQDALAYVKMLQEEASKTDKGQIAPKFGTFSMVQMKNLREQEEVEKAESLRVRSHGYNKRASILSDSEMSIAFGCPSEATSTVDTLSETSGHQHKKKEKTKDKKKVEDGKKEENSEQKDDKKAKEKEKHHHHHQEK